MKFEQKQFIPLIVVFIFLTCACSVFRSSKTNPESNPPAVTEIVKSESRSKPGEIRQWANSAIASSQYGYPNWAATQAVGKPNVEFCGDNSNAWASKSDNTVEWIELTYATPLVPTEINIYQSYHPSQIVEVMLIATNGDKLIAWEGYPESVINCPDLMTITVEFEKKITIQKIQITVDQRVNGWGWNEIDAVELVGMRP